MNKRTLCILAALMALILIVAPAAAGIYSTRMPNIRNPAMNLYSQATIGLSPNNALLSAVQAKDYQPRTITAFGTGSEVTTSLGDLWTTRLIPPVNFGCGCGCSS